MLVVSPTSQGICALIWVGETYSSGDWIPLKYTSVPPSCVGNGLAPGSALTVLAESPVPTMLTKVPGASEAASPPPVRLAVEAVAVSNAAMGVVLVVEVAAATTTEYVTLLPRSPGVLASRFNTRFLVSATATRKGSPAPLRAPFSNAARDVTMPATVSVAATV